MKSKFSLGQLVTTPTALAAVPPEEMYSALDRYAQCDWGVTCKDDARQNDETISLEIPSRLMAVYQSNAGTKFWIITEADRSVTTILLPEDY